MKKLLLATGNPGKLQEMRLLLQGLDIELHIPAQLGLYIDVEESGNTYEENAARKAQTYALASRLLTLADDSGLEVNALNGEPGVRSARYAGESGGYEANNRKLLEALRAVPDDRR